MTKTHESLCRLEEGEKAIKELEDLKLSYESFVGHHEATMEDLESLKCCGNCDLFISM